MRRIQIEDISSMDEDQLERFNPGKDPYFLVIDLDLKFKQGADSYRFSVCNFLGLKRSLLDHPSGGAEFQKKGYVFLNDYNLLLLEDYSYEKLICAIKDKIQNINVEKDTELYMNVIMNKYFYWEYQREFLSKINNSNNEIL